MERSSGCTLRILLFTPFFPNEANRINGIFNLARATALGKSGHRVLVIAPIGLTPPSKYFIPYLKISKISDHLKLQKLISYKEVINGFTVYHPRWFWLPKKYFWQYETTFLNLFCGRKIRRILNEFNPNIIISTWIHPYGTYAKYFKKYAKIPALIIPEGDDILIYPERYSGWQKIENMINLFSDKVICVSGFMFSEIGKMRNLKRLVLVKNGLDSSIFNLNGLKNNRTSITKLISVGYFGWEKGHDILFQSLKLLKGNFQLMLIGDGDLKEEYVNFVRINGLDSKVVFPGRLEPSELKANLSTSDIFCMPSRSESFGIAAIEAMACGLPVVATRVGGLAENIINGFNGYLCDPESPKDLAEKIEQAVHTIWDPLKISDWAIKNFSWDKWANDMINIITEETQNKN